MRIMASSRSSLVVRAVLLSVVLVLSTRALAAAPTSFCKCTCFGNSTIISLGGQPGGSHAPHPDHEGGLSRAALLAVRHASLPRRQDSKATGADDDRASSPDQRGGRTSPDSDRPKKAIPPKKAQTGGSCNECNRKFCLSYNLPICKSAREGDVFTTCFQRDSRKDQAVVLIFIIMTGGLLVWAGIRHWVVLPRQDDRREYIPVPTTANT